MLNPNKYHFLGCKEKIKMVIGIKKIFKNSHHDPRNLEPQSRAPNNTSKYKKDLILKTREEYA